MTGLERQVHIPPGARHALRRYLTPFYSIALGLVFILAASACGIKAAQNPATTTPARAAYSTQDNPLVHSGTQALTKISDTPLPEIPPTPNESTPSPLGVNASELRGLQVTLWLPWNGADGAGFQAILDKFNLTNKWGITAVAKGYLDIGSLDDAIEAGLSSHALPDVIVDYGYQARRWDESGVLVDLAPYVGDAVWGYSRDEQADFYPSFWLEDMVSVGRQTKRLGIPYYRSAEVIFYNQSWAEELGYPTPPTTPEEFRARACSAADYLSKKGDKSTLGKGGWLVTPDPAVLVGWIYAFGGSITNPDASGYAFDTPQARQALTFLKNLQESGCAWLDTSLDPQSAFAGRQALFVAGSLFDIPAQQAAFEQSGSIDNWMAIPFPSSTQPVVDSYGPSLFMTSSTPEEQLASWLVMQWLVYPPNQAEYVQQLGVYPTRQSALRYLIHTEQAGTQWAQALGFLPGARAEPTLPFWSVMRWALSDASSQLFSLQFQADQVPSLVLDLDSLAQEVLNQER